MIYQRYDYYFEWIWVFGWIKEIEISKKKEEKMIYDQVISIMITNILVKYDKKKKTVIDLGDSKLAIGWG